MHLHAFHMDFGVSQRYEADTDIYFFHYSIIFLLLSKNIHIVTEKGANVPNEQTLKKHLHWKICLRQTEPAQEPKKLH